MNRAITRVFLVGVVLFVALVVNVTYIGVIRADDLRNKPENHRAIAEELRTRRGLILGFDDSVIAGVQRRSGFYERTYPQGPVAPQLVGYNTVRYGRSGIEQSMNEYLAGTSPRLGVRTLVDRLLGRRVKGANVKLTIVPAVQKVAQQALAGQRGAICVLDPLTGAVIADASAPAYEPARLDENWAKLSRDPAAPLLNRVAQGLYPPGSSFKVVTAGAALQLGEVTPDEVFVDTGTYHVYGGTVTNYGGAVFGRNAFTEALTYSINTTFAKVGNRLGKRDLVRAMEREGFYSVPPLEVPAGAIVASGRYGPEGLLPPTAPMDPLAVAWAAVGQEQILATPLQMALVASSVANQGKVMKPYAVQEVITYDGAVIEATAPEVWRQGMQAAASLTLNQMMREVVSEGTGTGAALEGIEVAGKTGTAEKTTAGGTVNEAWFIGFAPAAAPRVAVAVLVEDTPGTGGAVAAPLAGAVLRAALAQPALP